MIKWEEKGMGEDRMGWKRNVEGQKERERERGWIEGGGKGTGDDRRGGRGSVGRRRERECNVAE
jgi:hypothetical protein